MSRFLISVGATLACVLAALFFLPQFVNWNHFRSAFEEEASRLLARDVHVGGEVNLRLLPTPYIRFDRVRVAGTKGGAEEPLLKADEFTIRLAVAPLFRGTLEATQVELTRPVLTLIADGKGGGNWSSIATGKSSSVFVPRSVTLRDVRITDGTVVFKADNGDVLSRVEAASADFSATTLEGPYKLQAMVKSPGGPREVRLSTAKSESDGGVRFKATMRPLDGPGPVYTLDGQLADLAGRTRIAGELAASVPLPGDGGAKVHSNGSGATHAQTAAGQSAFDLKATLEADTEGVQLSDLSLSFDSGGRPQLATGDAQFFWREGEAARIRLEARWLDLDQIAGGSAEHSPLGLVATLAAAVDRLMPSNSQTQATFVLDQATLGGEVVSGIHLTLDKSADGLKLRELRASLPGGTRLEASGTMMQQQSDASFDGEMTLRGASLNRFLGWVGKGQGLPEMQQDGSFAVRAGVTIGTGRIAGRNIMLQLGGNALSGQASWNGETRSLAVALDASALDASPLVHGGLKPSALLASLLPGTEAGGRGTAPGKPAAASAPPLKSSLRLRAGRLVLDTLVLRDVVADIATDQDSIRIPLLKLASEDGLAMQVRGAVTGLAGNAPKGSFGGDISASQAGSLRRFVDVMGLPQELLPSLRRAEALAPLRLGATATIGGRAAPAIDISVDGMLARSRMNARVLLEDARLPWREQRIDVTATVENPEISSLLAQLLPESLAVGAEKGVRTPGRAMIKAAGVPARGAVSLAALDAPGLAGEFRGRLALDETATFGMDGETRITTDDLGYAATLVGLGRRPGLSGLPSQISFTSKLERHRLRLEASKVAIGSTDIAGKIDVDLSGTRPRVEGSVRTSEVSLPGLLALMEESRSATNEPANARAEAASLWPESAIDLSAIANIDGKVRIESPSVTLAPSIELSGATLDAQVENGRLDIKLTDAHALGGRMAAQIALEKTPAGASLRGEAQLANASLEAAGAAGKPAAVGEFAVRLGFSSVGLSPRGLIAAMRGKGAIAFGSAQLNRMTPAAIDAAALAALAAPGDNLGTELRRHLEEGLRGGALKLGPRELAFEVADGIARTEAMTLETPDGRVTANTTVDLETLSFDSEWRVEPKLVPARAGSGKGSLPGVTLVYAGRLAQLAAVEPKLQSDALERELNVRKMERYVEELERLRRQDEERARREAERLRNQELERQRIEEEQLRGSRRSAVEAPAGGLPAPGPLGGSQSGYIPRQSGPSGSSSSAAPTRPRLGVQDFMRDTADRSH